MGLVRVSRNGEWAPRRRAPTLQFAMASSWDTGRPRQFLGLPSIGCSWHSFREVESSLQRGRCLQGFPCDKAPIGIRKSGAQLGR